MPLPLVAVVVEVTVVVVAAIKFRSVNFLVVRAGGDGDGGERGCMMDAVGNAGGKWGGGGWGGQGCGLCVAAGCGGG